MNCPLDCVYLEESRGRDKAPILNPDTFPNQDIRITDQFLKKHEWLLLALSSQLVHTSLARAGVIDYDVREALGSLIQTYRTLDSGLLYESRPANPLAALLYEEIQAAVRALSERVKKSGGNASIRDTEILGVLVFLQRLELQHNNGRHKGRAFIDFLKYFFPQKANEPVVQL
ncbi:MAG TPA: hypothetical protein VMZ52_06285 [Bryobacteraceae bacterium]|nr:hypothetical protein [Bryobacteraceae bacterium]